VKHSPELLGAYGVSRFHLVFPFLVCAV